MVTSLTQDSSLINGQNAEAANALRPAVANQSPLRPVREQQVLARQGTDALRDLNVRLAALAARLGSLTPDNVVLAKAAVTDVPPGQSPTVAAHASWQAVAGDYRVWVDQLATNSRLASQEALGQNVATSAPLARAGLPQRPTSGVFTINGASFAYNAQVDSLDELIARINASEAGVIAGYDPASRKLVLVSRQTGEVAIRLQDRLGNFLAATRLLNAQPSPGQNAIFRIDAVDGGRPLSSPINTIAGLIPGVTLDLVRVSKEPVTVQVSQDSEQPLALLRGFVDEVNQLLATIRKYTSASPATRRRTAPAVESSLRSIQQRLQEILGTPAAAGEVGFADVGVAFAGPETSRTFRLNEGRFRAAVDDDPAQLASLFRGSAGARPGVLQELGQYVRSLLSPDGPLGELQGTAGAERTQRAAEQLGGREQEILSRFRLLERTLRALQLQFQQLDELAERK